MAADNSIQPAPPGLLSLLALKTKGMNPSQLADSVVPVVDLTHWYGMDALTLQQGTDNTSLASAARYMSVLTFASTPLVVPNNEIWWVKAYTVTLAYPGTLTNYDIQSFRPVIRLPQVGIDSQRGLVVGDTALAFAYNTAATLGSGNTVVGPSLRDVWAPPGSDFAYYISGGFLDAAAGPATVRGLALVNRLLV